MKSSREELGAALAGLQKLKSQEEVAQQAYGIVTQNFRGKRFHNFLSGIRFFGRKPEKVWAHPGLMDCMHQNKLLRLLLVGSGQFRQSDISLKWTLYWNISPHQYLKVRLSNGDILKLDPWAAPYGIKFGDYAHGFHTKAE